MEDKGDTRMKILEPKEGAGRLAIMKEDFLSYEEFKETVSDAVMLLLKANYKLKVFTEIPDEQVIIDYTWGNDEFGTDIVIVSDLDEYEAVEDEVEDDD